MRKMLMGLALIGSAAGVAAAPVTIDAKRLSDHVRILGSDAYEGRGVATRAEAKTIDYLVTQFRAAGLQPGGDVVGGKRLWTQGVPLLKSEFKGDPTVVLNLAGAPMSLAQREQIAVRSPMDGSKGLSIAKAPLLFVGFGVAAPERGWDDFKGVDVHGKILVLLINDPDIEGGEGSFGGKAMSYYGRWTYKYEGAARSGGGDDHPRDGAGGLWLEHGQEQQHQRDVRYRPGQSSRNPHRVRKLDPA